MPNWKKLIVSGSDANLNSLNITTDLTGSNALITNDLDVLGNVTVGTGIGVGTTTVYSNSINLNNSGTVRIGNAEFLSKSSNDLSIYQNKITIKQGGNVGIGTTVPAYKLDVNSSAFVGARIESTAAGYAPASILLESGHADSRGQGIYQYNSVSKNSWFSGVPYSTTSDDWVIAHKLETTAFNSDVAQMSNALFCVNDSGFVGIGTTNSAYKLQVYDASSSQVRITNGLATPVDLQLFASSSSYAGIGTASNHRLALRTNNTEKVTILANGNVGIGTTSPQSLLHLQKTTTGGVGPVLFLDNAAASTLNNSSDIAFATWSAESASAPGAKISVINTSAGTGANAFVFYNKNTSGVVSEKMRISSTGATKLNSYGSGTFTGTAAYTLAVDSSGNIIETDGGTGTVSAVTNGVDNRVATFSGSDSLNGEANLTFDGSTLLTAGKVHASGSYLQATNAAADSVGLKLESPSTGVNVNFEFEVGDTGISGLHSKNLVIRGSSATSDIAFSPSTAYPGLMMLDGSAGNVGIGTTSPGYKLTVEGSVAVQNAQNLWLRGGRVGFENTALDNAAYIYNIGTTGSSKLNIADSLYVVEAGNVGIGTTSPGAKLDVRVNGIGSSAGDESNSILFQGDRHDWIFKQIRTAAATDWNNTTLRLQTRVDSTNMSSIDFVTDASYNRHIDINTASNSFSTRFAHNGNVGIGTDNPSEKLHVYKEGSSFIKVDSGATSPYLAGVEFLRSAINGGRIYNDGGAVQVKLESYYGYESANPTRGGFTFKTAPVTSGTLVDALRINALGDVGIGTSTPGYKLDIDLDDVNDRINITTAGTQKAIINGYGNIIAYGSLTSYSNTLGGGGGIFSYKGGTATQTIGHRFQHVNGSFTATSGDQTMMQINPNINQTSTAGYTGIKLNVTETATGSGDKNLLDLQVDGVSKYKVNSDGDITTSGDLLVTGKVTAQEFHTTFVSASIMYESGSTKFGDTVDDNHDFTGSLEVRMTDSAGDGKRSFIAAGSSGVRLQRKGDNNGWAMEYGFNANDGTDLKGFGGYGTGNSLLQYHYIGGTYNNPNVAILAGGNVGIGTTSPSDKLDVHGAVNSTRNIVSNNTYTLFTGRSSRPTNDYGGLNKQYLKINLVTPGSATTGESSAHGVADLRFQLANNAGSTAVADIMTLRYNGNVGIGTISPQSKLHIEAGSGGTYNPNANHDDVTIEGNGNIGLQLFSPATSYQYIAFGDPDSVNAGYLRYYHGTNEMVFRTNGSDNMVINSNGNVGIGASSPGAKLDIVGSSLGIRVKKADLSDVLRVYTQGSGVFVNNGDFHVADNVGIGTTNPSHKLTVNAANNTTAVGIDFPSAHFDFSANSTSGYTSNFRLDNVGMDIGHDSTARSLNLQTGNLDRVTILGNGKVGIGTITPTKELEVMGGLVVNSGFNTGVSSLYLSHTGTQGQHKAGIFTTYTSGYGRSSSMQFALNDQMTGAVVTTADAKMTLLENGNVGIGTTSPALQSAGTGLHLNATTSSELKFTNNTTGITASDGTALVSNGNDFLINNREAGKITLGTSNSVRMTVLSGGNVGIGTTTPSNRLSISGPSSNQFEIINSANSKSWRPNVNGNDFYITESGVSNPFVIQAGGNVGIGTTTPSSKLDIEGDLQVKGVNISNQENLDVDTGTETIATVVKANYDAAFFDFVIKNGTNLRAGTVFAIHDGTNVEFTETSTNDLGDTSDVTLSVDISGTDMRLRATTTTDNWIIKSLVRTL
mgnify:CR=1 FL=1